MKAIWTLIFLAIIATTVGLALLFVPESGRTETFWLSVGTVTAAEFFLWVAFTFGGTARGEQAGGLSKLSLMTATTIYFFVALHIVMFVRVLMLKGTGLSPFSSISIAVAALIMGKAVLLADMLPIIKAAK